MISVAIFNVLSHRNQFLLAQVLLRGDESTWILAAGTVRALGQPGLFRTLRRRLSIAVLPVLAAYLAYQRQVQAGPTAGQL
ncbi:hypothetical protein DDE19_25395 [Micromonospora ureilytica]|uniref:Uncharacterized protein n=1 Tax=Micromonospora ureilytica TaxID=709868 RepID=A0A3N9XKP5_9ACTN|nr:hypothetical protein DDE19_25395 [Micromonospora ureilytica]